MDILNVVYKGIVPIGVIITLITMLVLSIIVFIVSMSGSEKVDGISALILSIPLIALVGAGIVNYYVKSDKVDYYEVTIDETVKMTEFYDKYKIISKNGKIYRIKERGQQKWQ